MIQCHGAGIGIGYHETSSGQSVISNLGISGGLIRVGGSKSSGIGHGIESSNVTHLQGDDHDGSLRN
jgi:hypothetical protein